MTTKTIYVSIGNSDDKLTQARWAEFFRDVDNAIRFGSSQAGHPIHHGAWTSLPTAAWQNACWCVVITPHPHPLKGNQHDLQAASRGRPAPVRRRSTAVPGLGRGAVP